MNKMTKYANLVLFRLLGFAVRILEISVFSIFIHYHQLYCSFETINHKD